MQTCLPGIIWSANIPGGEHAHGQLFVPPPPPVYSAFKGPPHDMISLAMFVHSDPYMVAYSQMISMNPELYASTDTSDMAHEFLPAFRSLYPSAIVKLSEENVRANFGVLPEVLVQGGLERARG